MRSLWHLNEAMRSDSAAIQFKPYFAEAYNNRGSVLHDLGRIEEASRDFDRALQIDPRLVEAHINRAHALALLK